MKIFFILDISSYNINVRNNVIFPNKRNIIIKILIIRFPIFTSISRSHAFIKLLNQNFDNFSKLVNLALLSNSINLLPFKPFSIQVDQFFLTFLVKKNFAHILNAFIQKCFSINTNSEEFDPPLKIKDHIYYSNECLFLKIYYIKMSRFIIFLLESTLM